MSTKKRKQKHLQQPVSFRIDEDTFQKLSVLAERDRRRVGELCRFAVEEFVKARTAASASSGTSRYRSGRARLASTAECSSAD